MSHVAAPAAPIDEFIATARRGSSGLLIEGPAGIGKSFHYNAVLRAVAEQGWRILEAHPAEAETRLGGCGLIDLLADITDDELAQLPTPQHRALAAALLREVADGDPDPQVIAVAVTTLVRRLSEQGPLLIAIDDMQWLDAATGSALGFLVRRLPSTGVALLAALRTPNAAPIAAAELEARNLLTRYIVPPLSTDAVADLVEARVGLRVPASVLARAAATSAGNPFYAVELARSWAVAAEEFMDALPVPDSLQSLVGARITALPPKSRDAVKAAAALSRPSVAALKALGLEAGLPDAERAGVVSVAGGQVRFTHPMLAAAAYDTLTGTERADLHRQLASVEEDLEHRARHLALASQGPDGEVAAMLDLARAAAERRGDTYAALDQVRLALHVSPRADPARHIRRQHLARLSFRTGDTEAAQAEYEALADDQAVPAAVRARALISLSEITFVTLSHEAAVGFGTRGLALAESLGDAELLADAHLYLAMASDAVAIAGAHARTALEIVEAMPSPVPARLAQTLAMTAGSEFFAGLGLNDSLFRRALEIEQAAGVPAEEGISGYYLAILGYSDEIDRSAEVLSAWRQQIEDEACESQVPFLLMWESNHAMKVGDLAAAQHLIDEHLEEAGRLGQQHNARYARYNLARLALMRGDLQHGRAIGETLRQSGIELEATAIESIGCRVVGDAALFLSEAEKAIEHLTRFEQLRAGGREDVSSVTHLVHLAEALIAVGRVAEAGDALDVFEEKAVRLDRASALALCARGRALVSAATGDEASATALFDEALSYYADARLFPFDRARTLLLKGTYQRRLRRKAAAKQTLELARSAFASMGATGWVERVDGELSRIGLRPAAPTGLTATEQKVAELAASGMTAKDVAAALFLSPRTVEDNLARAYRKLGISSRAELGARLEQLKS